MDYLPESNSQIYDSIFYTQLCNSAIIFQICFLIISKVFYQAYISISIYHLKIQLYQIVKLSRDSSINTSYLAIRGKSWSKVSAPSSPDYTYAPIGKTFVLFLFSFLIQRFIGETKIGKCKCFSVAFREFREFLRIVIFIYYLFGRWDSNANSWGKNIRDIWG